MGCQLCCLREARANPEIAIWGIHAAAICGYKGVFRVFTHHHRSKGIQPLAKPTTDKNNLDVYRTRLLDLRARLRGEMGRMADAALSQGRSETSSLPIHLADLGSDNFEQELTLSLVGSEKEALDKIEFALERIAEGSYGKCEDCGKKIPESRLEAIPYTAVCVQCAAVHEQRGSEESKCRTGNLKIRTRNPNKFKIQTCNDQNKAAWRSPPF